MILVTLGLTVLFLVLLWHAIVWLVPLMAGIGAGWLAITLGSGWLVGIGAGLAGATLAIGLFPLAMACRLVPVRIAALALYAVPPMLAGGSTTRALALETGADGAWAVLAAVIGGAVFGATAIRRLAELAPEPRATVHAIHQPVHRMTTRRGDDRVIEL